MSPLGNMKDEDRIWRALGDPTRRSILDDLAKAPLTTGDLVGRHPALCRTAVMKHLAVLESVGLVVVRREGRYRWNYINPVPIERICARWIHGQVRHLSAAVNRLRKRWVSFPRSHRSSGALEGTHKCSTGPRSYLNQCLAS